MPNDDDNSENNGLQSPSKAIIKMTAIENGEVP